MRSCWDFPLSSCRHSNQLSSGVMVLFLALTPEKHSGKSARELLGFPERRLNEAAAAAADAARAW